MNGFLSMTMMIWGLALLGLAAASPASERENVHEQMTEEEVKQVFQTESHAVPDYEVVPIHWPRLHKRSYGSASQLRLNAFGTDVDLWLNPTEGILAGYDTPVYLARTAANTKAGVRFDRVSNPMNIVGQMLEDKERQATLIVRRAQNGRNYISGNVGSENWVVRPLPDRFNNQYRGRWQRSVGDYDFLKNATEGEYYEPHYHVIYKKPELPEDAKYISLPIKDDVLNSKASRSKRSAPTVIYPQILVMVDYGTYQLHGEDVYRLLEYLLPFWNGVDLRYRGLESPKVRINIAGIVIAVDPTAFSYVSNHKVTAKMLNIYDTLDSSTVFMRQIDNYFPTSSYDIAITMAPYDMCSITNSGPCLPGTLGLAYVGGACDVRERPTPKTLSVAVIQDKGAFDGMHTAAHELGHLLGANHDGVDASVCSAEMGHIMAASPILTEHSADWSRCSLQAFETFLNSAEPTCLFDKPRTRAPFPRILPGRLLTMDQQCEKLEGTKFCNFGDDGCMRLRCVFSKDSNYCTDVGDAAADGSICGTGKICLHGKCLAEEEII